MPAVKPSARKPRRLRAALACLLLLLTAAIAASWVKSYLWCDDVCLWTPTWLFGSGDCRGRLLIDTMWCSTGYVGWSLEFHRYPASEIAIDANVPWHALGFWSTRDGPIRSTYIPHWFPLLFTALATWLAARPWLTRRRTPCGFDVVTRNL